MRVVHAEVHAGVFWWVTFIDEQAQTPLGIWLLFRNGEGIRELLHRGNAPPEEILQCFEDLRRWGGGCAHLRLSEAQFALLQEAGRRDPRTAYEKINGLPHRARSRRA